MNGRSDIDKATVRNKLQPRREPYWGAPIERGLFLGFRRLEMGGNWIARLHHEGKHTYRSIGKATATNDYEIAKKEARRWAKHVTIGITSIEVVTVADACKDYVASLRGDSREATASDAERRFRRTIYNDELASVHLEKLRESQLISWRKRIESGNFPALKKLKGRSQNPKPMTASSFKRNLSSLKAALNRAVAKRYVGQERAIEWVAVKPAKNADGRRDRYLSIEQRQILLASAEGPIKDLIQCVLLTGCRPGDPVGLVAQDYKPDLGMVTYRSKEHVRTIPLSPSAKELFDKLNKNALPNDRLFKNGKSLWKSYNWSQAVRTVAEKAGLPEGITLYTLRHCWITDAIVGGMDLLTVAKLSGTSLAMIEKHYGHLVQGAAREKLAKIVFI